MKPKIIIVLVLILLFLIILAQNTQVVNFRILFWTISMSQIILLAFSVLIGFVIGYLTSTFSKKQSSKIQ